MSKFFIKQLDKAAELSYHVNQQNKIRYGELVKSYKNEKKITKDFLTIKA